MVTSCPIYRTSRALGSPLGDRTMDTRPAETYDKAIGRKSCSLVGHADVVCVTVVGSEIEFVRAHRVFGTPTLMALA